MKNIVVISQNYPSNALPHKGAFVYNLVQELSKIYQITVIAPFNIRYNFNKKGKSYGPEACKVLRPGYLSLGNKKLLGIDVYKSTFYSQKIAVEKALKSLKEKPSLIYCHFLVTGLAVLPYIKKNKIPLIIASGESSYSRLKSSFSKTQRQALFDSTNFIICVSGSNQIQLKNMGFDPDKMHIIPNAVDFSLFKPRDKEQSKKQMGLDPGKFVVGFIGHFINRKGPNRIIEAIALLKDPNIVLICVGSGDELQENNFTRIIAPMPNGELPDIINAFDVFVLPTLSEGHCNVIEEVKACCIPIISSKGTTVETQITNGQNGVLIDPKSILEIKEQIKHLQENPDIRERIRTNLTSEREKYSLKKS